MTTRIIKKRYLMLGGLLVLAMIGYLGYRSASEFGADVSAFSAAQRAFSDAAFAPGSNSNQTRDTANRALSVALADATAPNQRITSSRDGLALLKVLETEIDAIADARDTAAAARERLSRDRFSLTVLPWQGKLGEVLALADKQSDIIADIRGLSYSANYHTAEIFKEIIADDGELRASFVEKLNDEIPAVEADFNRRSNLYLELEQVDSAMLHAIDALPGA